MQDRAPHLCNMNAAWDRAFPDCISDGAGRRKGTTLKWGLRTLATLPWAQDIGRGWSEADLRQLLTGSSHALIVLDLPAGVPPLKELPKNTSVVLRHTRQSPLNRDKDPVLAWPSTRRKQFNRAEREGMTIEPSSDLSLLVDLHQAARLRKGITSDEQALRNLLQELLLEPNTHAWAVRQSTGEVLAGGVFHGAGDGRCIYGFGGQFRTESPGASSRATVLLIGHAMRQAAQQGAETFDFGGSMDPGVDRFYAEFGAPTVAKQRLVRMAPIWRPILRWRRPDLFQS